MVTDKLLEKIKRLIVSDGSIVYYNQDNIVINIVGEIIVVSTGNNIFQITYKNHSSVCSSFLDLSKILVDFVVNFIYES
jgi:hypothetical protein